MLIKPDLQNEEIIGKNITLSISDDAQKSEVSKN